MVPLILLKMKLENALLWKRRINYRALNRFEKVLKSYTYNVPTDYDDISCSRINHFLKYNVLLILLPECLRVISIYNYFNEF